MSAIPGYRLQGILQVTGNTVLQHAEREADHQRVMLKMPRVAHPGPREHEQYRKEYRLLERLRGTRGVLRAYGCEVVQERPVLVLEDVGGRALSEVLQKGPLEVERGLEVGIALADILAEVHRRGVIHKDIKPSNLLVDPEGEVWLIDFGISTLQQVEHVEAAPANQVEGTLAYMSPEQTGRMNQVVDYRTDLYSLGVTLYEALTGQKPFQGRDALEWFHAHLAQVPRPLHEVKAGIAPAVSAVVLKLMAKAVEERYQSAEGLKADLEKCLEGLRQGRLEEFRLGEKDIPARFLLPQRLYGRQREVGALLEGFERVARSGKPELLLVSGYSGIGKSSVVNELHRPVLQRRSFFLRGKFDQFQRDVPYATLAQAFRGLVQQLLATSDEELEGWRQHLLEAWEGNGQVLVELVPPLELVAGKQPPVPELPALEAQNRFNRLFQRFLGVFATADRPLVLFLDDLQWADLASLQLIHYLITHPDTPPVLLVGAYRDNEVSPSHPLMLKLEEMSQAGARRGEIRLAPLLPEQTRHLVSDTLPGAEQEVVAPLAALVQEKTQGNPFFLLQLLQTLHQDGLVTRAPRTGWSWDAEGARAKGYSDNVVDFLVVRLRQLPPATQQLLRLAACVGSTFPLHVLALLCEQPATEVEQGLEPALQENLLVRSGAEQYRFQHDRIQQAARALVPEAERRAVHLRIGRLLLASLGLEEMRERLFDVVNQLNAGAELMQEPAEREKLSRLNAEAGARAKASAAYRSAVTYFTTAFSLLPGDPWEQDFARAFKLRLDLASSELMSGNPTEAHRLVDDLQSRARTRTELASVYLLRTELHMAAGKIEAAVACILECLERFGLRIPMHPSWKEVEQAQQEVLELLGERPIASLVDLPLLTDPDTKALISLLSALYGPAYFCDPHLYALHSCRLVALTLRHGNTEASVAGYALYGVILVGFFRKYREAYAFGQLSCDLMERLRLTAPRAKILLLFEIVTNWNRHLSVALELARNGFHHAVLNGDLVVACFFCSYLSCTRLLLGDDLAKVYQEAVACRDFVQKVGFRDMDETIRLHQRYTQQLRGLTRSFHTLSGEDFEEESFEAGLEKGLLKNVQFVYWVMKLQSRFMCGAYEEAREASARARDLEMAAVGHIHLLEYHLFRALTLAACYREASAPAQEDTLEAIRQHQRQLEEWAHSCPENFRAPERMVSAELARLTGRTEEAWRAYGEAIRAALQHGFIQNVALASELAARFWRQQGMDTIALAYAREAREAYRQWGADGKVRHLEALWPYLEAAESSQDTTTTSGTNTHRIDALTVAKAQRAISSEIMLEKLARTLLHVALENAGAQRGALLLLEGDKLSVAASSDQTEAELPWTLVAYVRRTREAVLIGDATQPHAYAADSYFQKGRARSVLCLPLLRQEKLHGVLYLENELAADAFTAGSQMLLGHIATQAAISMENARLYAEVQQAEAALRKANEELEKRVEERTWQLQQAQARLVDTARSVGMAEIASNILHNVGNVLTSVVIETQMMRRTVQHLKAVRVRQVSDLLEEHRGHLAEFFTQNPRGNHLPDYLLTLSSEIEGERARLVKSLESLEKHVDHIRAIVQVQQSYAKTTLLEEECDLRTLVEDALRIQFAATPSGSMRVTKELEALPLVRVDKHKVLQILVNLLSNAQYALEGLEAEQRHLTLRLQVVSERVRIQVVDNGAGIAPHVRESLFVHGFTTRKDGHGFGLHASSLAAKQMGGQLTLESEGPGQGATATLELPLSLPKARAS